MTTSAETSTVQGRRRRTVIAVCGSTGTGKSQLAVELANFIAQHAARVNGGDGGPAPTTEIISADSMQTYRGLDVITNKMTREEMDGIPHHLIDVVDPASSGQTYDIVTFVQQARAIMENVYANGGVPIVVGGTAYYMQHLLLPGKLIANADNDGAHEGESGGSADPVSTECVEDSLRKYQIELEADQLDLLLRVAQQPKDASIGPEDDGEALRMWSLLQRVDRPTAAQWHYRDRRKVLRSLRVFTETGRPQSEWATLQREQDASAPETAADAGDDDDAAADRLTVWIHCDPDELRSRLDRRVDRMVERGLLEEIRQMRAIAAEIQRQTGEKVDYTRGIFQAIGYKEFDAYLTECEGRAGDQNHDKLFADGLEAMKIATRQYAKKQVSWLRNKLVPALLEEKQRVQSLADGSQRCEIVVVDGTDLTKWEQNVAEPARHALQAFLAGQALPTEAGIRVEQVAPSAQPDENAASAHKQRQERLAFDVCPVCTSDEAQPYMVMRSQWQMHLKGRTHRAAMRARGLTNHRSGPDTSEAALAKRAARQALKEGRAPDQPAE